MGSWKLTLCAGVLAAAALTPTAYATVPRSDAAGVFLTPASPAPGSDVRLRAQGCAGGTGTAVSTAFVADARLTGAGGVLTGDTRVRSSLAPGTYDVTVGCDGGQDVRGTFTVAAAARPLATLSAPASPVAPVRAGGGGTAPASENAGHTEAMDARAAGPGTRQAVVGLVLAGVAAVAVALRSARRGRDTSEK